MEGAGDAATDGEKTLPHLWEAGGGEGAMCDALPSSKARKYAPRRTLVLMNGGIFRGAAFGGLQPHSEPFLRGAVFFTFVILKLAFGATGGTGHAARRD